MTKFLYVALLCILGATLSKGAFDMEAAKKQFAEYSEHCLNEAGAAKSDVDDLLKANPAAGREAKCFRACLMKKYKAMDDNGKFVKSVAMDHAKALTDGDAGKMKIAESVFDTCGALDVPADACEAVEVYAKCMKEHAEAQGVKRAEFLV